jgi:hypothetical protein
MVSLDSDGPGVCLGQWVRRGLGSSGSLLFLHRSSLLAHSFLGKGHEPLFQSPPIQGIPSLNPTETSVPGAALSKLLGL